MEGKECKIDDVVFAQDSTLCDNELCYVCKNGVWQQKSTSDSEAGP